MQNSQGDDEPTQKSASKINVTYTRLHQTSISLLVILAVKMQLNPKQSYLLLQSKWLLGMLILSGCWLSCLPVWDAIPRSLGNLSSVKLIGNRFSWVETLQFKSQRAFKMFHSRSRTKKILMENGSKVFKRIERVRFTLHSQHKNCNLNLFRNF